MASDCESREQLHSCESKQKSQSKSPNELSKLSGHATSDEGEKGEKVDAISVHALEEQPGQRPSRPHNVIVAPSEQRREETSPACVSVCVCAGKENKMSPSDFRPRPRNLLIGTCSRLTALIHSGYLRAAPLVLVKFTVKPAYVRVFGDSIRGN